MTITIPIAIFVCINIATTIVIKITTSKVDNVGMATNIFINHVVNMAMDTSIIIIITRITTGMMLMAIFLITFTIISKTIVIVIITVLIVSATPFTIINIIMIVVIITILMLLMIFLISFSILYITLITMIFSSVFFVLLGLLLMSVTPSFLSSSGTSPSSSFLSPSLLPFLPKTFRSCWQVSRCTFLRQSRNWYRRKSSGSPAIPLHGFAVNLLHRGHLICQAFSVLTHCSKHDRQKLWLQSSNFGRVMFVKHIPHVSMASNAGSSSILLCVIVLLLNWTSTWID